VRLRWSNSDADIFCTWKTAPLVRQRLVENWGLVCTGMNDSYVTPWVNEEPAVHHVEGYAPCPSADSHEVGLHETDTVEEYYQQALKYGDMTVAADGQATGFLFSEGKPVGLPGGAANGKFPYRFDLCGTFVQLIIGRPSLEDAREMLNSFDLTICKTYFDGETFHVPSPQNTFKLATTCTNARHTLITEYMAAFFEQLMANDDGRVNFFDILRHVPDHAWEAVGLVGTPGEEEFYMYHLFVQKLLIRMQRYAKRGIKILDAPFDALHFQTRLRDPIEGYLTIGPPPLPGPVEGSMECDEDEDGTD